MTADSLQTKLSRTIQEVAVRAAIEINDLFLRLGVRPLELRIILPLLKNDSV